MSKNTAPIKDIRTEGIVLRRTNYGEADRILNILTPKGKITAIAKSVRKARSKLAGGIEMCSVIDFNIHLGRSEMGVVTGAKMLQYFDRIVQDFLRMELLGVILKKTNRAADSSDTPEFYEIVKQCMEGLNEGADLQLIEGWFLLNLVKASGGEVNLYRDTDGNRLAADNKYNWDIASESFIKNEYGEYGADEIKMLRLMMTADLKTTRRVKISNEMCSKLLDLARMAAQV